jgi:hypothetical protein
MALIDQVKRICDALADAGWQDLMLRHGIDIKQPNANALANELDKEIDIDGSVPGFGDFSRKRARGIEPGDPAGSALYHALASPGVRLGSGLN